MNKIMKTKGKLDAKKQRNKHIS